MECWLCHTSDPNCTWNAGTSPLYLGMTVRTEQDALLRLHTKLVQRDSDALGVDLQPFLLRVEMVKHESTRTTVVTAIQQQPPASRTRGYSLSIRRRAS